MFWYGGNQGKGVLLVGTNPLFIFSCYLPTSLGLPACPSRQMAGFRFSLRGMGTRISNRHVGYVHLHAAASDKFPSHLLAVCGLQASHHHRHHVVSLTELRSAAGCPRACIHRGAGHVVVKADRSGRLLAATSSPSLAKYARTGGLLLWDSLISSQTQAHIGKVA